MSQTELRHDPTPLHLTQDRRSVCHGFCLRFNTTFQILPLTWLILVSPHKLIIRVKSVTFIPALLNNSMTDL